MTLTSLRDYQLIKQTTKKLNIIVNVNVILVKCQYYRTFNINRIKSCFTNVDEHIINVSTGTEIFVNLSLNHQQNLL